MAVQVFLCEQDSQGAWALTHELKPEPAQAASGSGHRKGRRADFSAKLAMFKAPAKVQPYIMYWPE